MIEYEEYKVKLNALKPDLENLRDALKLDDASREIEELEPTRKDEGILPDEEAPQDEDLETEDGSQEAEDGSQATEDVTKDEDASPQFKYNPATGELSLFGNEEV